jgi:diadenosine tetraphosphatase ApaH/serine/threonine PP2A family protein phosphatase
MYLASWANKSKFNSPRTFKLKNFAEIREQSLNASSEDFIHLTQKIIDSLSNTEKRQENITISDKLVYLKPVGEALVIGDLHGDLESLSIILETSSFLEKMASTQTATMILLGDYGDRGAQSPELFYSVLSLKLLFPKQVFLLRGNHEGPIELMASPHDLPQFLQRKFYKNWVLAYQKIRELFDYLFNAVYVEDRYLMVHGGLPSKIRTLKEIAQAGILDPGNTILEELLWNDPDEKVRGTIPSPRGAGNLFGKSVTQEILARLNAKILIRGHETPRDGFKINHDGKILTLFSRKGPPYYNATGAFLTLPLAETFEDATQLVPYIHKF